MKQKLPVTVDAELVPVAKHHARSPIPAVHPQVPNSELF